MMRHPAEKKAKREEKEEKRKAMDNYVIGHCLAILLIMSRQRENNF